MVCPEGDILLKGSNGTIRSCHVTADRAPRDADTELKGKQDGIPQQMVGIQLGRSPKVVALFSATKFSSYIIELLHLHDTIQIK